MCVVRSGNVEYIDIRIGEHFVIAVIHLADIVFFGKSHSLVVRPVAYGKQISSVFLQSGGCFIGYNACTQYRPVVVFIICSFYKLQKSIGKESFRRRSLYAVNGSPACLNAVCLILPSIILSVYFKVALRMITYGTYIGSLCAYYDVTAVTAFPYLDLALFKYLCGFYVL